ncbi:MAG: hypothetical protein ACYCVB_02830, partial [Bacilli bacterium]
MDIEIPESEVFAGRLKATVSADAMMVTAELVSPLGQEELPVFQSWLNRQGIVHGVIPDAE